MTRRTPCPETKVTDERHGLPDPFNPAGSAEDVDPVALVMIGLGGTRIAYEGSPIDLEGRCRHSECVAIAGVREFDGFCVTHATPEAKALAESNRLARAAQRSGIHRAGELPAALADELAADIELRADVGETLRRKRAREIRRRD